MLRFFNISALTLMVATAAWAYQTKYETIYYAEQVKKLEARVEKDKDQIAILKAEWQLLNRPSRIEALAARHLDLKPLKQVQLSRGNDLPAHGPDVDQIGAKLDSLGMTGTLGAADKIKAAMAQPMPPKPAAPSAAAAPKPAPKPAAPSARTAEAPKSSARVAPNAPMSLQPQAKSGGAAQTQPR